MPPKTKPAPTAPVPAKEASLIPEGNFCIELDLPSISKKPDHQIEHDEAIAKKVVEYCKAAEDKGQTIKVITGNDKFIDILDRWKGFNRQDVPMDNGAEIAGILTYSPGKSVIVVRNDYVTGGSIATSMGVIKLYFDGIRTMVT